MFGLQTLDVVIGLVFFYLVLSLACSAAQELFASFTKLRASTLEHGIKSLLGNLSDDFYAHPLIQALHTKGDKPSFVSADSFVRALLYVLRRDKPVETIEDVEAAIEDLPDSHLKRSLQILTVEARKDLDHLRDELASWFEEVMDQVSILYKNRTQIFVSIFATVMVIAINADSLMIAKALAADPALRESIVEQAQATTAADPQAKAAPATMAAAAEQTQERLDQLLDLGLPLGWNRLPVTFSSWLQKIFGLLISILAVSLGAPFWFDATKLLIQMRSDVAEPEAVQAKTSSQSS